MKRILLFLLMIILLVPIADAGRHKSYYSHKHKTTTIYHHRQSYKTPGVARDSHGKIKRSRSAVHQFLKDRGLKKVPKGYQVDHIVPLWKGGSDSPSNMQLMTTEEHRSKTSQEAHERAKLKRR